MVPRWMHAVQNDRACRICTRSINYHGGLKIKGSVSIPICAASALIQTLCCVVPVLMTRYDVVAAILQICGIIRDGSLQFAGARRRRTGFCWWEKDKWQR